MAEVLVDGVRMRFQLDGAGPPCFVLHGFTGSHRAMRGLVTGLAADHLVVAPDLVGHGASDVPARVASYTMAAVVSQLDGIRRAVGVQRIALVGYSFGARVALSYAVAHPDAVSHLVTIGGTPGVADADAAAARRQADEDLADAIEADGVPAFVDRWEQAPIFGTQAGLPDAVRAEIRAGRLANDPVGLANSLRGAGTGSMPPLWDRLATVTVPATVIVGALDQKFVDIGRSMVELLPRARLELVPAAGHAAHLEAPELCLGLVRAALGEVSTS